MTEQQKNERLVRLARFMLARVLELATGKAITLHWINLDTGLAMFKFDPNDAQIKTLIASVQSGASS